MTGREFEMRAINSGDLEEAEDVEVDIHDDFNDNGSGSSMRDSSEGDDRQSATTDLLRTRRDDFSPDPSTRKRLLTAIFVGIVSVVILGGLVIAMIAAAPSSPKPVVESSWRLPNTTIPSHYDIHLTVNFEPPNFLFRGTEDISIEILEPLKVITINAAEIVFESVTVQFGQRTLTPKNVSLNTEKEFAYIEMDETLNPGNYTISIQFIGVLNDELRGFYRSTFVDKEGDLHYIAVTQFESTDARRAFPCFDEPAYKATFTIQLTAPKNLEVMSNMPQKSAPKITGDLQTVNFQTTPKMSTYLVAFVIGEFEKNTVLDYKNRPVSVWTILGKKQQATYATTFSAAVLQKMEEYFGIDYPIPKLDLVAIPDFSAGAMENWGLVTFRETALLIAENAPESDKERVADVVAHELVHQWTGDLVTCSWWGTLWLNEGFANFYEPDFVREVEPEFSLEEGRLAMQLSGMISDSYPSSHPIVLPVNSPDESSDVFDGVTYDKGASILRMISTYIDAKYGNGTWQAGVRRYLKKYQFSNADTPDLWNEIGNTKIPELNNWMFNWTNTAGYPVITFTKGEDNTYTITQKRYFSVEDTNEPINNQTWWIPVSIQLNGDKTTWAEVSGATPTTVSLKVKKNDYFKANVDQTGFYRVNYPKSNWEALKSVYSTLPDTDRAGLISDLLYFSYSGELSAVIALDFLNYTLPKEKSKVVWDVALPMLNVYYDLLADDKSFEHYAAFLYHLLSNIYHRLCWVNKLGESHSDILLRGKILMAIVKYTPLYSQGLALYYECFDATKNASCTKISSDVRTAVYYSAVRGGHYDSVLELYKAEQDSSEKARILQGLGASYRRSDLEHFMALSLDSSVIRSQDRERPIVYTSANLNGRELAWVFMQQHFQTFNARGFGSARLMAVLTHFSGEFWYNEFKQFFDANPPSGAQKAMELSLDTVLANGKWLERNQKEVSSWLMANSPIIDHTNPCNNF